MIVCSQARWRGSCVGLDQLRPCVLWSAAAEGATGQLLVVQERGAHDIVRMEFWRVPGHLAVHRQTSELHYVSADGLAPRRQCRIGSSRPALGVRDRWCL